MYVPKNTKNNLTILPQFVVHWKPAKKNQIGCDLGAKFGPNYAQCCEKSKETGNIIRFFFHILLGITF